MRLTALILLSSVKWFYWLYPAHKWGAHDNRSRERVRHHSCFCVFSQGAVVLQTDSCFSFMSSLPIFPTTAAPCVFGASTKRNLSARWNRLTVAMVTQGWSSLTGSRQWRHFTTRIRLPQVPPAVRNQLFNNTYTCYCVQDDLNKVFHKYLNADLFSANGRD